MYHANDDAEALRAAEDFAGDNFLVYSTWAWLEAQVKTGGSPVYRYLFALPSPGDPYHPVSAGAFHSDEIEYVFGNLDSRKGAAFRPEDYKLSDLMQTLLDELCPNRRSQRRSRAALAKIRCSGQLAGDAAEPGSRLLLRIRIVTDIFFCSRYGETRAPSRARAGAEVHRDASPASTCPV